MMMTDKYKPFDRKSDYRDYTRERDEHLYQLWKQRKTQGWMANYIDRSKERVRLLFKTFEKRAKVEEGLGR